MTTPRFILVRNTGKLKWGMADFKKGVIVEFSFQTAAIESCVVNNRATENCADDVMDSTIDAGYTVPATKFWIPFDTSECYRFDEMLARIAIERNK